MFTQQGLGEPRIIAWKPLLSLEGLSTLFQWTFNHFRVDFLNNILTTWSCPTITVVSLLFPSDSDSVITLSDPLKGTAN